MRRLIRPQHAQHQWELPKFTSKLLALWPHPADGIGAAVGSLSVWPHWQRQADHTILDSIFYSLAQLVVPVKSYRNKGIVLGHPSPPAGSCLQLTQIIPKQMGQVSAASRGSEQERNIQINRKFCSQHISAMIFLQGSMWSSSGKWEREQFFFFNFTFQVITVFWLLVQVTSNAPQWKKLAVPTSLTHLTVIQPEAKKVPKPDVHLHYGLFVLLFQ